MYRRIVVLIAAALAASAQSNLPNLAAGVLDQTGQARQAIAAHDRDTAIGHVRRAIATVDQIQQSATDSARPLMIPVYREVETTTTVTPVKHKDAALKHNSSVRGVDGESTTARLDITAAGERLHAAQASLEAGDFSAADAALGAVEKSVSVTQTTGDMPLRMVKQNLELAKARVQDGKYREAELPLKSAAQAIGDYERLFPDRRTADMESARQAMLGYSAKIAHEHDDAAGRIDAWMDMLRQWTPAQ
jgi:hypothetical protein